MNHDRELGEIHATLLSIKEDLAELKIFEDRLSALEKEMLFFKRIYSMVGAAAVAIIGFVASKIHGINWG